MGASARLSRNAMRYLRASPLTLLVALAICPSARPATADPAAYVLRLANLPTGFTVESQGVFDNAAAAKESATSVAQYVRWGRMTGYEREFAREASLGDLVRGALQISSSASIYKSVSGARASTAETIRRCRQPPAKTLSLQEKIGEQRALCSSRMKSGGYTIQVYVVVWRRGVVKAGVAAAGLSGAISSSEAVALARKQDAAIRRALNS